MTAALLYAAFLLAVVVGTFILGRFVAVRPRPRVRLSAPEDSEHPVFSAEMMIAHAAAHAAAAEEPESP